MYDFVEKSMQSELWQVYKTIRSYQNMPKTTQPKLPTAENLCLMNVLHPLSSVKAVTDIHWSLLPRRATEPIAASLILNIAISEPLLIT